MIPLSSLNNTMLLQNKLSLYMLRILNCTGCVFPVFLFFSYSDAITSLSTILCMDIELVPAFFLSTLILDTIYEYFFPMASCERVMMSPGDMGFG